MWHHLLFIFLAPAIIGFNVVRLSWRELSVPLSVAMGVPIGFAISSALYYLCRLAVTPTAELVIAVEYFIIAGTTLWTLRRNTRYRPLEKRAVSVSGSNLVAIVAMIGLLGSFLARVILLAFRYPLGGYDALAMWNYKARLLMLPDSGWTQVFERGGHPDYPLLVSCLVARGWTIMQSCSPFIPVTLSILFGVAVLCICLVVVYELRGITSACICGMLLCTDGKMEFWMWQQYADLAVACYLLAIVAILLLCPARIDLLVLAAACACWTKNEGLLIAVAGITAGLVLRRKLSVSAEFNPGKALPGMMASILLTACALHVKMSAVEPVDLMRDNSITHFVNSILDPQRYLLIAGSIRRTIWPSGSLGSYADAVPIVVALVLLFGMSPRWITIMKLTAALSFVSLVAAGYVFVYLVTPRELSWHLDTSLERLWLHLLPSVFVLVTSSLRLQDPPFAWLGAKIGR